jgi:NADH dehydrogenase
LYVWIPSWPKSLNHNQLAAAVGTVQFRSLIEPIRKIIARLRGHFVQGKAVDLVLSENLIEVETKSPAGVTENVYIPYDARQLDPTSD